MARNTGKKVRRRGRRRKRGFATWSIGKKIGAVLGGTLLGVLVVSFTDQGFNTFNSPVNRLSRYPEESCKVLSVCIHVLSLLYAGSFSCLSMSALIFRISMLLFAIMNACGSCVARCLAVSTISAISFFSFSLIAFLTSHSFIDFLFLLPYTFMYRHFHAE